MKAFFEWLVSLFSPKDPTIQEAQGAAFLKYIESFIGVPYQWGGDFKKWKEGRHFGLDCSGFEQAVAAWQGVDQPGDQTADGIMRYYLKNGKEVRYGDEQVGDRVFYGRSGKATHIVVVVGKNKIVGANGGGSSTTSAAIAKKQGASIKYQPLNYRSDIICIIRPNGMKWSESA